MTVVRLDLELTMDEDVWNRVLNYGERPGERPDLAVDVERYVLEQIEDSALAVGKAITTVMSANPPRVEDE